MTPRRLVRHAVAAILAGAVVTVLVAWALALNGDARVTPSRPPQQWPVTVPADWPKEPRGGTTYALPGRGLWQYERRGSHSGNESGTHRVFVSRAGWPFAALESALIMQVNPVLAGDARLHTNDGTLRAGLPVPLTWTVPHESGPDGWCARRLPVRPLPWGFLGNSLLGAAAAAMVAGLWRLRAIHPPRGATLLAQATLLILAGGFMNVLVALALWAWWQRSSTPMHLHVDRVRPGASSGLNATLLPALLADWPCTVPSHWPACPRWIGWLGSAPGVRGYELTSEGIPEAVSWWLHTTWSWNPFDSHQSVRVVQAGWPMACLQSEELITSLSHGRVLQNFRGTIAQFPGVPLERSAGLTSVVLPGSPAPVGDMDLTPYLPVRPLVFGFAVNTLVYALAATVLFALPGAARTLWRRRRGRCLGCGYAVLGLAVCPECGNATPAGSKRGDQR